MLSIQSFFSKATTFSRLFESSAEEVRKSALTLTELLTELKDFFPGFEDGGAPTVEWLTALSALLSNLVSNVPAVMLLSELIPVSETDLWIALASSSTLAGNATILGAAANVIVAEKAEGMGVEVDFWKFTLVGFPIAMATLFVSTLMLLVLF